jgi:hypothetical protein
MQQSPSCEANQSLHLVKKFPEFLWNRRFFTVLTSARQLSLSWAKGITHNREEILSKSAYDKKIRLLEKVPKKLIRLVDAVKIS